MKSPKGNSQILPFPRILSRGRVALLLLGAFWASASFAEPVVYTDDTIPEANIVIGADGVEFQVSGTKTYDYTMSGTGPFYKTGEGTLTLPRTNTYTGATTVSAGTLLFSCDTLPVSAMKATGGTLALGTEGNTIKVKRGSSLIASGGAVRVDGNLVFESPGSGFVACDGTWTGSGSIKLDGGYIRVGTNFNTSTGINFNGGSILNNNNNGVLASDITITKDGSTMQAGWSKMLTLTGALKGSASLTVGSDSGWLRFSGDGSQYKGSLLVKGNMRVGKDGVDSSDCTQFIGAQVIKLNGGTIQNNNNNISIPNDLNVMSETGFKSGWSKNITLTGNVTGSGKLKLVSDSGWLILKTHSEGDAFTGPFQTGWASTSSRGQTRLAAEQPLGANAGVLYNYGYLDMNGFSQVFKGIVDDGTNNKLGRVYNTTDTQSTLTLNITSQNLTYAGTIESNVELIINANGEGTQTFTNGGSSYTGNLVINGGKVVAAGSWNNTNKTSALGKLQSGRTVTVNKGAELVLARQDVIANASTNSLVQIIVDGGKLSNSGEVYNNLANTIFKNGAQMYASDGNATWLGYKLSSKVSVLRTDAAADPVIFSSDLTKEKATYSFGHGTSLYIEDVTSDSATALDTKSDLIISAIITNPHNESNRTFYKDGAGTLELTAANTFNGTASIREGVLRLSGNGTLGTSAVVNAGTLEFAYDSEQTFTNKVSGSGTVVKTGEERLKINAAQGFEASRLTASAGRLDFLGTMTGGVTVSPSAVFSPGNSVGVATVDGEFKLDSGATLLMEQDATGMDLLKASSFNVASDAVLDLDMGDVLPGSSYPIIQNTSGAFGDDLNIDFWNSLLPTSDASYWILSFNGAGDTVYATINASAVPEPSAWVMFLFGAFGLMCWRKRK